ncbi:MAG: DUF1622 domain-containing protein [Nocardiopsaceae bacterium]|nr:DUF1622 domain-containing protein [Nocardiopsaceae bacterium]
MTGLLQTAVLLVTALGLLSAMAVYAVARRLPPAVAVLLDFLTAAGLLRLAAAPSWSDLALAAMVIAIRKLVSGNLRASRPAIGTAGAAGLREHLRDRRPHDMGRRTGEHGAPRKRPGAGP